MLYSGNGKMKNIDVLQQINILRIYINNFGIKGFYWDFNSNPHFSFLSGNHFTRGNADVNMSSFFQGNNP